MSYQPSQHPQIRPEYSTFTGYFNIHIVRELAGGKFQVASEIVFKDVEPYEMMPPCAIQLRPNEGQELMDRLWACGLRPTDGKGTAGLTEAMKEHIKDLRQMAFGKHDRQS